MIFAVVATRPESAAGMINFPFAKVNLGLHVLRKRQDGFHDIESILVPIALRDALEINALPDAPSGHVEFTRSGLDVPGVPADDLCLKAVRLVQQIRKLPGINMHLHKTIPVGAGLGGGSSDATHTLLLLNKLFQLDLSGGELHTMAAELGSDCPFFLGGLPQLIEGRGERSRPIDLDLRGHALVLVHPGIHVSTAVVYRNTAPSVRSVTLLEFLHRPRDTWQSGLTNDMEAYVFAKHPGMAAIKQSLLDNGAWYAAMSGSGSSVFGIFKEPPVLPKDLPGQRRWCVKL